MTVDIKISVIVAWHIQFVCMYRIKGKSHVMSGLLLFLTEEMNVCVSMTCSLKNSKKICSLALLVMLWLFSNLSYNNTYEIQTLRGKLNLKPRQSCKGHISL